MSARNAGALGRALGVAIVGLIFFSAVAAAHERGMTDLAAYTGAFSFALPYNRRLPEPRLCSLR
jgi:hypothetical protein